MNIKFLKYILIVTSVFIGFTSFGKRENRIEISNGKIIVSIDLEVGGRIMEYSLNGNNVLFNREIGNELQSGPDGGRCDFGPEKLVPPRPET